VAGRSRTNRAEPHPDRGLTTRGRCLLAGGCAAIICAYLLDERDLLRVGILAVALPLVALVVVFHRRTRLTAQHRATPNRLHPGSTGVVELRIGNAGASRSRPLTVGDAPTAGLTEGVRCVLPPLRPRSTAVVRYRLHATRRGRFTIGDVTVRTADPLGLCALRRTIPAGTDVLVVPLVTPLAGMPAMSGMRSAAGDTAGASAAGGDPDVRIRPYIPGDDIRTIHWRASARRDDLVVRARQPVSHGSATVVIDHREAAHRGEAPDSSLEAAVSLAASISVHILMNDYKLHLATHSGFVVASGGDVIDDVMVGLAELQADRSPSFAGVASHDAGTIVAVTGALTAHDVRRMVSSKPSGSRGLVYIFDAEDWPAGDGSARDSHAALDAEAAASALRSGGWSALVARRGDDPAVLWRAGLRAGFGGGLGARVGAGAFGVRRVS
jgi:uncharacterized protein (DUF58 family)